MKHSFKPMLMAATMLALMLTFTSCDDILGEWSRPTPNPVTPGGGTATVTSISIDPTLALKVGETGQLTATVDPAGTAVTWSSDQEAIATVDANGLVTAKADGTATITAKAGDKSATCTVTVTEVYTAKDYKEASWDGTNNKVVFTKKTAPSDPTVLTNLVTSWSGWYTVSGEVTITGDVTLGAETHLILQDGATLNCQTIDFSNTSGYTLYIYGQDKGDGKLNISNSSATAMWGSNKGEIVIHGGEITAGATGISGKGLAAKGIRVYGGKLTATSTGDDGIAFNGDNFEVYGGEVEVETTNNYGTAIYSSSNTLKVYGGKVKATGGASRYGFCCKLLSGTDAIKFYFADSESGLDTAAGNTYDGSSVAPGNRYAKAE